MTDRRDCEQVRPVLAELATGAAAGDERAAALQHVAGCEACRQELAQLARTADELLLLAPAQEPPAGFESRVLSRLQERPAAAASAPPARPGGPGASGGTRPPGRSSRSGTRERNRPPGRRRSLRRILLQAVAATAAVILATGVGAGIAWRASSDDRQVAAQHRKTLEVAGGRYLAAMPITAAAGARTGTAFLYQGKPSWMLITITGAPADGRYEMLVVGRDGVVRPGGSCEVRDGGATAGYRLYRPVSEVAAIQLNGPNGVRLTAHR